MDYIHAILSRVYLINISTSKHTRNTQTIGTTNRETADKKTQNQKNKMKWIWGEIAVDTHEPHEPHINSSISIHEGASVVECHHSILYLICQIISFIIITIRSACSVWMMESCVLERGGMGGGRANAINPDTAWLLHIPCSELTLLWRFIFDHSLFCFVLIIFQIHYCNRCRCCFVVYEANMGSLGDCVVMVNRNLFSQYVFINQAWDRTYNRIHPIQYTAQWREIGESRLWYRLLFMIVI